MDDSHHEKMTFILHSGDLQEHMITIYGQNKQQRNINNIRNHVLKMTLYA